MKTEVWKVALATFRRKKLVLAKGAEDRLLGSVDAEGPPVEIRRAV